MREKIIKKKLKELKEKLPGVDIGDLERDLLPLEGEDVKIKKRRRGY
ncbi:MAG: hypothetical protein RMJ18_01105 [Candidatus Aenigmarchaeota archaeon]|nr:hypothetical protein [Candidatus Aenigmarchaeota archaeon]MCX8190753.1 hypothetical protein [Candidatus Aenigmarchaeota archaeon]MDW8160001.1 hypothetical protein [Candidatus Aenigmarchaeota archaeon]